MCSDWCKHLKIKILHKLSAIKCIKIILIIIIPNCLYGFALAADTSVPTSQWKKCPTTLDSHTAVDSINVGNTQNSTQPRTTLRPSIKLDDLIQINKDFHVDHEAKPKGVPDSFDWYARPKIDRWNIPPSGFGAITGWGQAFWAADSKDFNSYLQIRAIHTLVCSGVDRHWYLVQRNTIEGAEFRPDYKDNTSIPTQFFATDADSNLVRWGPNGAFHFWPANGRALLPEGPICGILVMQQARSISINSEKSPNSEIILGFGADYWLNKAAPWNNYRTNSGIGVGRLKLVTEQWQWFGFSSANDLDLRNLYENGYFIAK